MFHLKCSGHVPSCPIHAYSPSILEVAYVTDGMQNNKIIIAGAHLERKELLISPLLPAVLSEIN